MRPHTGGQETPGLAGGCTTTRPIHQQNIPGRQRSFTQSSWINGACLMTWLMGADGNPIKAWGTCKLLLRFRGWWFRQTFLLVAVDFHARNKVKVEPHHRHVLHAYMLQPISPSAQNRLGHKAKTCHHEMQNYRDCRPLGALSSGNH